MLSKLHQNKINRLQMCCVNVYEFNICARTRFSVTYPNISPRIHCRHTHLCLSIYWRCTTESSNATHRGKMQVLTFSPVVVLWKFSIFIFFPQDSCAQRTWPSLNNGICFLPYYMYAQWSHIKWVFFHHKWNEMIFFFWIFFDFGKWIPFSI